MASIEEVNHLQIPLKELSLATDGFSEQNLIAKGGFGNVYRGISAKHGNIAIKLLDSSGTQGDHEFKTEIALLSVYKHENIASLVGFCDEAEKKILVYKYETNGSLDKHLNKPDLTWVQRLQICIDAACGLLYLHDDVGFEHRILHRDVKSANILLDENWRAKISDFGLSRIGPANKDSTFLISNPCGTFGYMDPDYVNTGYLTQKSDVYSFGIVLFEVLCGRLTRVSEYQDHRQFLINLVKIHWSRKTLDEIICSHLRQQINRSSLRTYSTIAYQCLMSGNERPTMKEVVEQLQKALDNHLLASSGSWSDDDDLIGRDRLLTSYSQSSPSSSTSHQWNYDVFLSLRGEDTRKSFANHLYHALVQKGIHTYTDDITLPRGESLNQSLIKANQSVIKAIQESRIAIIIFSKNYASSSWCLDELALIMQNVDERGQLVMPVFYDVDPSEVRRQTKHYAEAFASHELNKNNNKVETWRRALKRAADIAGWALSSTTNGYEATYIKEICESCWTLIENRKV